MFEKKCDNCKEAITGVNISKKRFCNGTCRDQFHNRNKDWKKVNDNRKEYFKQRRDKAKATKAEGGTEDGNSN